MSDRQCSVVTGVELSVHKSLSHEGTRIQHADASAANGMHIYIIKIPYGMKAYCIPEGKRKSEEPVVNEYSRQEKSKRVLFSWPASGLPARS